MKPDRETLRLRSVWQAQPEAKFQRAQEAQRGVIERMGKLITGDVTELMGPDDLEILALQFQLAAANLRTAARDLRECEDERRRLAAWRALEERRFECVTDDLNDLVDRVDGERRAA